MTRWLGGELSGFAYHFLRAKPKIPFLHEFLFPGYEYAALDDFSLKDPAPFLVWGLDSFIRLVKHRNLAPHDSLSGVWE